MRCVLRCANGLRLRRRLVLRMNGEGLSAMRIGWFLLRGRCVAKRLRRCVGWCAICSCFGQVRYGFPSPIKTFEDRLCAGTTERGVATFARKVSELAPPVSPPVVDFNPDLK